MFPASELMTDHTDCFNQHLKTDLPHRKHIYYSMVHDNAAFQFIISVEDYHTRGKLGREFWEVQGHSCFAWDKPPPSKLPSSFPDIPVLTENHYVLFKTMNGQHLVYLNVNSSL